MNTESITVTAYNMRTLRGATPYITELMSAADVLILSEHRLYPEELYKLNEISSEYEFHSKASSDLDSTALHRIPGHCGISICWKKKISNKIRVIQCPSDRICIIEVSNCLAGKNVYIIGVYLPQSGCRMTTFSRHHDILDKQIENLKDKGYIAIIGDINCHFGKEIGTRFWGSTSPNAAKFYDTICKHNMFILDGCALASGPTYSFHVEGIGTSYLDHCIVSREIVPHVLECTVLDDHYLNSSDHLPITVSFKACISSVKPPHINYHIKWNKITEKDIEHKYTIPLQNIITCKMSHLLNGNLLDAHSEIETCIDTLVNSMISCSKSLVKAKIKQSEKPYWCKHLTEIAKRVKDLWAEWKYHGRPRGDHPLFLEYKLWKKKFRKERIRIEIEYEQKKIKDICESQDMDIKLFWKLVNKGKKGNSNVIFPIKVDENVISDPDDIRSQWMKYFQTLLTPKDCDHYDKSFKEYVDRKVKEIHRDSYISCPTSNYDQFTYDEIKTVVLALKMKKAPGYDCIVPEHIRWKSLH